MVIKSIYFLRVIKNLSPFILAMMIMNCINPAGGRDAIAIVGRYYITTSDFESTISYSIGKREIKDDVKSRVLDGLIEEVLILNDLAGESKKSGEFPLGIYSDPEKRQGAVLSFLESSIYAKIDVTSEEIAEYYKSHKTNFTQKDGFLIQQIVTMDRSQIEEAGNLLKSGHDFMDVAMLYSISPERGRPILFERDEIPPSLYDNINALKQGEISGIINPSEGDVHEIILLKERIRKKILPLEEVKTRIRMILIDWKRKKLMDEYRSSLLKKVFHHIYTERLNFAYNGGLK